MRQEYRHTLRIFNTLCFFLTMVRRMSPYTNCTQPVFCYVYWQRAYTVQLKITFRGQIGNILQGFWWEKTQLGRSKHRGKNNIKVGCVAGMD